MELDESANQFLELLTRGKHGLGESFPNIVAAVLVLAFGWGLAWMLRKLVRRVFRRVPAQMQAGPARAAWTEAVGEQRTGDVAASGVYWLILLTALMIAIDTLDLPLFSKWIEAFASYLPKVAVAVALVLCGVIAGRLARNAIIKTMVRAPALQVRNLGRLVQVTIVVASALIAAGQLGLDVSLLSSVLLIALAAALGGAALAFGFGARDVMADILAMHYVQKSYRLGQVVRIGSDQGRIVRTTRTAVVLETPDGELSVPGRHFGDNRSLLVNQEEDHDSRG